MMGTRFKEAPLEWIELQARSEAPFRWASDAEAVEYLDDSIWFFGAIGTDYGVAETTITDAVQAVAANLADIISQSVGSLAQQTAAVTLAAIWLSAHYARTTEGEAALVGFWDSALTRRAPSDWTADLVLFDAVFAALSFQLASPNKYVQLSALHGLNHLRHPRTVWVVDALVAPIGDEEVRAYAAVAKRFEAM